MTRLGVFLTLLGAVTIGACGGSGPGGSNAIIENAQLARVALTVAPERSSEIDGVVITFSKVVLVPEDGGDAVTLFESDTGEKVNLSELDTDELLFVASSDVPEDTYDRMLVTVDDVSIASGVCADLDTVIPDDELELVFEEPVDIEAGDRIVIQLSMNTDKSVQVTVDGSAGTCTVRPVLEVRVTDADAEPDCPTTAAGTVTKLLLDLDLDVVGFELDLGGDRGTQTVLLGDDTAIFDARGLPTDTDPIGLGEGLTTRGLLDDEGDLRARIVAVGRLATVKGTVVGGLEGGAFVLEPDEDEELAGETRVVLFDGTWVLLGCDDATLRSLVRGAHVTVMGKVVVGESVVRAASVQIDASVLVGEIRSITAARGGWDLRFLPFGTTRTRDVFVSSDDGFLLQGDGAIPADLLTDLVDCEPRVALVKLDPDDDGVATEVRVEAEECRGIVTGVNASTGVVMLGDTIVRMMRGATVLDLRGGQRTASLEDLEPRDRVRVFGLSSCPDARVDFHGFVLLILPRETPEPPPVRRDEGCGQGFWKNHTEAWPRDFPPTRLFDDVFADTFPRMTLHDVIGQGGGGIKALGRHVVAALLNAASERIDYPLTVREVIRAYDEAVREGGIERLKDRLEDLNEAFCPYDDDRD